MVMSAMMVASVCGGGDEGGGKVAEVAQGAAVVGNGDAGDAGPGGSDAGGGGGSEGVGVGRRRGLGTLAVEAGSVTGGSGCGGAERQC